MTQGLYFPLTAIKMGLPFLILATDFFFFPAKFELFAKCSLGGFGSSFQASEMIQQAFGSGSQTIHTYWVIIGTADQANQEVFHLGHTDPGVQGGSSQNLRKKKKTTPLFSNP